MPKNILLKIDGVQNGESQVEGHTGEIELDSFSWGHSNPGSFGTHSGPGMGSVTFQDLHCVTSASAASGTLAHFCATGKEIDSAKLTVQKQGQGRQQDYYTIELQNVVITSFQSQGNDGSLPSESFALNFQKIKFEAKKQEAGGGLGGGGQLQFDVSTTAR